MKTLRWIDKSPYVSVMANHVKGLDLAKMKDYADCNRL